jgi:oligopeptide transport system permease protein
LRNPAAVVGALVLTVLGVLALAQGPISAHVTRYTFDEQHWTLEPKPVGGRNVPAVHHRWIEGEAAAQLTEADTDGDGRVSAAEWSACLAQREFQGFDGDGSGGLDGPEVQAAPVNFAGGTAESTVRIHDADGDGSLSAAEARAAGLTEVFPEWEAAALLRAHDRDADGVLSAAEFPGLPEPVAHLFGTDELGRDLLTRVLLGARVSLAVGLVATLVSLVIGVLWGATAGYLGGAVDAWMMRFVDVLYGLPFMFLVILLLVMFEHLPADARLYLLFVALGAVQWLTMSRIVRGQVLALKNQAFVEAARTMGVPARTIIWRHLVPNALGPIIVYATLTVPAVMLEEAFLSFLGLGVQAPYASWGSLAADGAKAFTEYPWLVVFPGGALALTLLALNFLGDALRDALDPRTAEGGDAPEAELDPPEAELDPPEPAASHRADETREAGHV